MARREELAKAKKGKKDEFYTQLTDIEKEMKYYKKHFENKVIFCNCDDPEWSNFWKYFSMNFDHLKLRKLIATHYESSKPSYKLEMYRDEAGVVAFATSDNKCTLGFAVSGRPKSLLKGNKLETNKVKEVDFISI